MDELTAKLLGILREHLRFVGDDDEVRMSDELTDLGLDSTVAVGLLLELERSFAISFPDEMLVPETFRTPETVRDAIRSLAGPAT